MTAIKLLCNFLLVNTSLYCSAQWHLLKRISLDERPFSYATDSYDHFYLGFEDGSLLTFNHRGEEVANYSHANQSPVTSVDPQFQLKTFLFYRDNQQITILDRFSTNPKTYLLEDLADSFVSMACPTVDGTFWVAENNPFKIKRIDPVRKTTIIESQPVIGSEIRFMKTYQNSLIISDEIGLHFLDQYGSLLLSIPLNTKGFTVINDHILSLSDSAIQWIDVFTGEIGQTIETPVPEIKGVLFSHGNYIFAMENEILLYQLEK